MSADFRATQMQARKYIRFDSTQELRVCAMSVKRADYRIIARTQASDRSMTRGLAQHARLRPNPNAWSPSPAHGAALVCMRNPALLIFSAYLQGSRHRERAQTLIRAKPSQASQRYEKRSDCHLQAYQIETTRKLFAIEFFFIAVITFLSFGRCKCAARRANRTATQVIRRV